MTDRNHPRAAPRCLAFVGESALRAHRDLAAALAAHGVPAAEHSVLLRLARLAVEAAAALAPCCFLNSPVGPPRELTALFRRRIGWDDGAIRDAAGAGSCCPEEVRHERS